MQQNEMRKLRSRIYQIKEYERYMFQNLTMEDNFPEAYQHYEEQKGKILQYIRDIEKLEINLQDLEKETETELQLTAEGLKLKVKKEDVCAEFSIETDVINIVGRRLLIDTDNFKISDTEAYFDGSIIANTGEFGGWKIEGNSLVGQQFQSGRWSSIDGGIVVADTATTDLVDVAALDFNPGADAGEIHTIDLRNAEISTSIDNGEDTNFGDLSIHGPVTLEGENSLECGDLDCTSLTGRATSKYITIFCSEIITEDESWSDMRLKRDIRALTEDEAESFIMHLRPVSYCYRKNDIPGTGFIAQEVKRLCDAAGYETMVEEQKGMYGLGYRQIIPLLIRQIQTNMERIEVLKDAGKRGTGKKRNRTGAGSAECREEKVCPPAGGICEAGAVDSE